MAQIFPIDFEEKLTMAQDDYILFSDSEDNNKIKKAQYSNLKWEKGDKWDKWDQWIQGVQWPQGEQWIQWVQWDAATITVWTVTTWAAWSSASVVNSWTSWAAVLDFTIPQWAKWDTWATGATWPQWPQGDKWDTGAKWDTWATWATWPQWPTWATWNWISTITSSKVWKVTTVTVTETNWNTSTFTVEDWADWQGAWDVVWPNSSVDWNVVLFDGNTWKLIKDSWATLPSVEDSLTSSSTTDALSANQGKVLKTAIDTLSWLGKFLSLWNSATWLPISFPLSTPYTYHTWDWFMVETIDATTNYKPDWASYTGSASTTVDSTNPVKQWDVYIYDGISWIFQENNRIATSFSAITWQPTDNTNLASALNAKQATLVSWTNIKTVNSTSLLGSWDIAVQPTLVSGTNIKTVNNTSLLWSGNVAVQPTLVSWTNIKTINSTSLLGSGDISVLTSETVVSGDSWTTYTIKVANSDPSGESNTTITFVL